MTVEPTLSSESSMPYIPTRLPIIILQRVGEHLPPIREVMVGAVSRQKNYIFLFGGYLWPKE